jgi:hypothetical protein
MPFIRTPTDTSGNTILKNKGKRTRSDSDDTKRIKLD